MIPPSPSAGTSPTPKALPVAPPRVDGLPVAPPRVVDGLPVAPPRVEGLPVAPPRADSLVSGGLEAQLGGLEDGAAGAPCPNGPLAQPDGAMNNGPMRMPNMCGPKSLGRPKSREHQILSDVRVTFTHSTNQRLRRTL